MLQDNVIETWSDHSNDEVGSGQNLSKPILILATISAGLSTILSLWTIWIQLKNYRKIRLQRLVVRILVMVPIYATSSLVSLYYLPAAFYLDAARDVYESLVIYCFFCLLVEYLGGERSLLMLLHGRPPVNHPWPMSLFLHPMDASDPFTFLALKRGILQYVQLKPILALVTMILKATGTYNDGSLRKDSGYTYVSIVYNLSITIALYALAMFWVATNDDLKPYRPMPKFICVKGLIFFSFWQSFAVSILVALGWVHSHRYETELLSLAIQDTLMCLEMPLFAFLHLYAFSYTDYIDENHLYSGRLPVWYALRDCLGYKDVLSDSVTAVKGTGFSYRTFEPAEGHIHQGLGRERRVRAGLRYAEGGKKKYWLDMPGEEADAYGRKGKAGLAARPLHSVRRFVEDRMDLREGYAPLRAEDANEAIHQDPRPGAGRSYDGDDWQRWRAQGNGYQGVDDSDTESLTFSSASEDEELYHDAKRLEFGDWSYPIVDASKEDVRRRLREEEEGRIYGHRKKKGRKQTGTSARGKGRIEQSSPSRPGQTARFSYGQLGEQATGGGRTNSAPATSQDHPRPEGDMLISGARHVIQAAMGQEPGDGDRDADSGSESHLTERRKQELERMPPDAIDLVVEDYAAEEEEAIRERRRGEPGGPKKRVYRQTYLPSGARPTNSSVNKSPQASLSPIEVPGQGHSPNSAATTAGALLNPVSPLSNESIEIKDTVPRAPEEHGSSDAVSTEQVVRLTVQEEELVSRQTQGPDY